MAHLEDSVTAIERTLQQVRDLSLDLRPSMLDDLGLVSALRWHLDRLAQRSKLRINFTFEELDERLPSDIETACFRIVQEALTNVARHAHARQVEVALCRRDSELLLVVQDDGCGFDIEAALQRAVQGESLGLIGMQERVQLMGGNITMTSGAMQGCKISAHFPLEAALRDDR